jgi:hypothetical protein
VFTLGLPDFVRHIRAYFDNDEAFYPQLYSYKQDEWVRRTRMHTLNWILRANGHKYAYDPQTLVMTLTDAGFVGARVRGFDPDLDSEDRRFGTLYVEARKPAPPTSPRTPLPVETTSRV